MFRRRHDIEVSAVALPRVSRVRLLETDEDFREAVNRARALERRGDAEGTRRALACQRYLDVKPAERIIEIQEDSEDAVSA